MIIWSGKRTLFNPGWVTLHWLERLNVICRFYAVTLSRYEVEFEVLPSYSESQVFILGMSWYQAKLIFSENYDLTIQTFSYHPKLATKCLPDNGNFFEFIYTRAITKFYILFQSLYKPILIFFRELLSNYTYFSKVTIIYQN